MLSKGTKELLSFISEMDAVSILGGGDTAAAASQFGFSEKITHISTGGGASLEYMEELGITDTSRIAYGAYTIGSPFYPQIIK